MNIKIFEGTKFHRLIVRGERPIRIRHDQYELTDKPTYLPLCEWDIIRNRPGASKLGSVAAAACSDFGAGPAQAAVPLTAQ
jgi:hypothetical protein